MGAQIRSSERRELIAVRPLCQGGVPQISQLRCIASGYRTELFRPDVAYYDASVAKDCHDFVQVLKICQWITVDEQ